MLLLGSSYVCMQSFRYVGQSICPDINTSPFFWLTHSQEEVWPGRDIKNIPMATPIPNILATHIQNILGHGCN